MPRHTTNNPRDSPTFSSGEEPSRHNPARGIMPQGVNVNRPAPVVPFRNASGAKVAVQNPQQASRNVENRRIGG